MIAKISKGRALRTAALYLLHGSQNASPGRGHLLATNFASGDVRGWAKEFAAFRRLKPNLARAVTHISLSLAPTERAISDETFAEIADRFRRDMGYGDDCPFLLVRHEDREHQHVHLLLSRIDAAGGVVPEANDYRKAERVAAALRVAFGLQGPADHKKNNKENPMENLTQLDTNQAALQNRLAVSSEETTTQLSVAAEPDAPAIRPAGTPALKQVRDWRRELLSEAYQRMLNDLFVEQIRYVRKSTKALTVYFKDGGRLHDAGDKITAYATPDPKAAAERLIALATLRGWGEENGIVLSGSDAFLREAAAIAISRNLKIVPLNNHQSAIFAAVKQSMAGESSAAVAPPPADNPLDAMKGQGRFAERLANRRDHQNPDELDGGNTPRLLGPR